MECKDTVCSGLDISHNRRVGLRSTLCASLLRPLQGPRHCLLLCKCRNYPSMDHADLCFMQTNQCRILLAYQSFSGMPSGFDAVFYRIPLLLEHDVPERLSVRIQGNAAAAFDVFAFSARRKIFHKIRLDLHCHLPSGFIHNCSFQWYICCCHGNCPYPADIRRSMDV